MRIKEVAIKNFRSIEDASIPFDKLTAFVGENGAGKSAVLKALDVFYSGNERITKEDFFNREEDREISISVTFTDLSDKAQKRFEKYLDGDVMTVEKVIIAAGGGQGTYHGARMQIPEFSLIRKEQNATGMRALYSKLSELAAFKDLPKWTNQTTTLAEMVSFEERNPKLCKRIRDDGKFFGFKSVGTGYLGDFSQFLYIPAVRDATLETEESRGSVLVQLMDLVVRSVIQAKKEVSDLKDRFNKEYREVLSPEKIKELGTLADDLTQTLRTLVPDSTINLQWQPLPQLDLPIPKSDVTLTEDGFESTISNTGHGLQRAYVITLLQHLVSAKYKSSNTKMISAKAELEMPGADMMPVEPSSIVEIGDEEVSNLPCLVLAIEEPELYQHPNRQRHFSRILLNLARGNIPGVAKQTQIVYTTHSPLFVGIDRFDQIRQAKKKDTGPGLPRHTEFTRERLDDVAEKLWVLDGSKGQKHTGSTLVPRLVALMTPWVNEGFFAKMIVLVEGEDDRALVEALLESRGCHPESVGMSVIPVGGKTCIDRTYLIFSGLGIPVFVIWDGDKEGDDAKPEDNRRLLRLLGKTEADWPSAVDDEYCVWESDLETSLKTTIGEKKFLTWLDEQKKLLSVGGKNKDALKSPLVIGGLIRKALESGTDLKQFAALADKLVAFGKSHSGKGSK